MANIITFDNNVIRQDLSTSINLGNAMLNEFEFDNTGMYWKHDNSAAIGISNNTHSYGFSYNNILNDAKQTAPSGATGYVFVPYGSMLVYHDATIPYFAVETQKNSSSATLDNGVPIFIVNISSSNIGQ